MIDFFSWWPWRKKPDPPQFGGAGASGTFEAPPKPAVKLPRGIRNKNPFNIEDGKVKWKGQTGSDGRFCTFVDEVHGIRAGCLLLITYQRKYGIRTITAIINRFAPASENNTNAYIDAVSRDTHFPATKSLNMEDQYVLAALASAIIKHENGYNPYPVETIQAGVQLAIASAM